MAGFPPSVRGILRARCDGFCELCGFEAAVDAHHRRARGAGGSRRDDTNTASNALAACRGCHNLAESHRNLARVCGWLVPQGVDPASIPVVYRGSLVFLDDAGNLVAA